MLDPGKISEIDAWLDEGVDLGYKEQPLAQHWARVAKVVEEAGEAVDALIGLTAQNPRKGFYASEDDLLGELADVAFTAIFAMQHFTKDSARTLAILESKLSYIHARLERVSREREAK